MDFEKMSDEQLLLEEIELNEACEQLIEKDEFGSYYYDCVSLDLQMIHHEKQVRGLQ